MAPDLDPEATPVGSARLGHQTRQRDRPLWGVERARAGGWAGRSENLLPGEEAGLRQKSRDGGVEEVALVWFGDVHQCDRGELGHQEMVSVVRVQRERGKGELGR